MPDVQNRCKIVITVSGGTQPGPARPGLVLTTPGLWCPPFGCECDCNCGCSGGGGGDGGGPDPSPGGIGSNGGGGGAGGCSGGAAGYLRIVQGRSLCPS
ncbi:MAG: hypothetical protein WD278_19935, partial [Pirellulales bacterium]